MVISLITNEFFPRSSVSLSPVFSNFNDPGDSFYIFPAFSPIQNLAVTLDYTSPWWWRWTSYHFPRQVPKSLDWRYVIVLCCFMSTQVALFRWQLWLVWCCVKLWDKYSGRILSQFLHNLVIANRERKRQLKNEFVLSAVCCPFFCILLQNSITGIFKPLKYYIHLNTVFQTDLQMLRCTEWSPRYVVPFCFPQVLLRSLEAPVSSQMGPLVATGRIVADWKEYKYLQLTFS